MHRFYCPESDFKNPQIIITDSKELHHLLDVLRLKKGNSLTIFNKHAQEGTGHIESIQPGKVVVMIESVREDNPSFPIITLACAIPKKSKFEWIIEKATELGVDEIVPLKTKRTEMDLKGERLERKIGRYHDVAVNAAKQSWRSRVPVIHPVTEFPALLKTFRETTVFIPSLEGEHPNILEAFKAIAAPPRVAFLIGPEGDFTPQEYDLARTHGCVAVSLGKTVLKVETAALAAIACAQLYYRNA